MPISRRAPQQVWCLHELRLDGVAPETDSATAKKRASLAGSRRLSGWRGQQGGGAKGGAGGGGAAAPPKKLLGLKERFAIAKILEDNRAMGRRRVDSYRMKRSLEEVAWVFTSLCTSIPHERVEAGLSAWTGTDCATFVRNLGLGQYASSFEFNLSGSKLPELQMGMLAQMGVASFGDQKEIMRAVRNLMQAWSVRSVWLGMVRRG